MAAPFRGPSTCCSIRKLDGLVELRWLSVGFGEMVRLKAERTSIDPTCCSLSHLVTVTLHESTGFDKLPCSLAWPSKV